MRLIIFLNIYLIIMAKSTISYIKISEIFKETGYGAVPPPTGRGLSVSRFQEK